MTQNREDLLHCLRDNRTGGPVMALVAHCVAFWQWDRDPV
jgi:hypothetical protein